MSSRNITEDRLFSIAREVEAGATMREVCHRYRISEAAFCAGLMNSLEQPLRATARKEECKSTGMLSVGGQWQLGMPLN